MNLAASAVVLALMLSIPVAFAQSSESADGTPTVDVSSQLVINEIELNPSGHDGHSAFEWIELYNPSNSTINIGDWSIDLSSTDATIKLQSDMLIRPGDYFTFTRAYEWLSDIAESVTLRDANGIIIDQTPLFTDTADDLDTWQRIHDALDTGSRSDWKFEMQSYNGTNGPDPIMPVDRISINVSTDKMKYVMGETVVIHGTVNVMNLENTSFFLPPHVRLMITGDDYAQDVILMPDDSMQYNTRITLSTAAGLKHGTYDIIAKYVGRTAETSFIVGDMQAEELVPATLHQNLSIRTDKTSYLPGETAVIFGNTNLSIEGAAVSFAVHGPTGTKISEGFLFPSYHNRYTDLHTIDAVNMGVAQFGTKLFIDSVTPVYGTYSLTAQYGDVSASTAFVVERDEREDVDIALSTDKDAYTPGDNVLLKGSANRAWVGSLQLEITQLQNIVTLLPPTESGLTTFAIHETVHTLPNGRFSYEFHIPNNLDRVGTYTVTASGNTLTASTSFDVIEDLDLYDDRAFNVQTDKRTYDVGDKITFSGKAQINDPPLQPLSVVVKITPADDLTSIGYILATPLSPDGRYDISNTVERSLFEPGSYVATASYIREHPNGLLEGAKLAGTYSIKRIHEPAVYVAKTSFLVEDPRDLGSEHFSMEVDRNAYEFGDTVYVSGITAANRNINTLEISILLPDGTEVFDTVNVGDDGRYAWSWDTPKTEVNKGVHEVTVSSEDTSKSFPFNVGSSASMAATDSPITINVLRDLYDHGVSVEIFGTVSLPSTDNRAYMMIDDVVKVVIYPTDDPFAPVAQFFLSPDLLGIYSASEKITRGIYSDGSYVVSASYMQNKVHRTFYVGEIPSGIRSDTAHLDVKRADANSDVGPQDKVVDVPEKATILSAPSRIVDTQTVLEDAVTVDVASRTESGVVFAPRSMSATVQPARVGASLGLTYGSDTCVIGNSADCLVTGNTRLSDSLYKTVRIDGTNFGVRYSGFDTTLLKLSIIALDNDAAFPDSTWTVKAVDGRSATLNYKVVYTPVLD